MKNFFVKQDNTNTWLGVLIAATAIAAATITYLYLNNIGVEESSDLDEDHSMDYLEVPKKKKHKTDLHDLHIVPTH